MQLNFVDEKNIKQSRRFEIERVIREIKTKCPAGKGMSRMQIFLTLMEDEEPLVEVLVRKRIASTGGDSGIEINKKLLHRQPEFNAARRRLYGTCYVIMREIAKDKRFKIKRDDRGAMNGFVRKKK